MVNKWTENYKTETNITERRGPLRYKYFIEDKMWTPSKKWEPTNDNQNLRLTNTTIPTNIGQVISL